MIIKECLTVCRGRREAVKDVAKKYGITPNITWFNLLLTYIEDKFKHTYIVDYDTGSYILYETMRRRQLGITAVLVSKLYVPKEYRGQGIIKKLMDRIPYSTILETLQDEKLDRQCVGRLYTVKQDI